MDQEDLDLEQRVWERVSRGPDREDHRLRGLMQQNEEGAAVYRMLAARSSGSRREKLIGLHRQAVAAAQCLRGMLILDGEEEGRTPVGVAQDSTARALARSFRRSCGLHDSYVNLKSHKEYGCVFEAMAQREAETMQSLLQLIGE